MTISLRLPTKDGPLEQYAAGVNTISFDIPQDLFYCRTAYSAAHVVCDPLADTDPVLHPAVDWNATLAYRRHLWSLGLSVAEAMDTAQRGMGLDWPMAKELIRRSIAEAKAVGGRIACGAGTDQLTLNQSVTVNQVEEAYLEQCSYIEEHGGRIILMASRALAACAVHSDDYEQVYSRILDEVAEPVILHWLGDMFDPALSGYWGHQEVDAAMEVCLRIINNHADKVDGIKISLLNKEKEIEMRRRLPEGVRMYSGDDFHYPELILGDGQSFSHALLGIFDAIAPAAAAALHALDKNDVTQYQAIMASTLPLSRHIFQTPTYAYKTGIVFMAYLNGHQSHFRMIGGAEGSRSVIHLSELFKLADKAGLLLDPELAARRMRHVLSVAGIDA